MSRAQALFDRGEAPKTADAGVPMGARVGSLLTFKVAPFLRASDSLVPALKAGETQQQIVSISRLRVPMKGAVHRFYVMRGDDGVGDERFLQVFTDAAGEVKELVYFDRLLRLIPQSRDEQDAYMGANQQGLGCASFSLYRSQFDGLDIDEAQLARAFGDADTLVYERCVGDASVEFMEPFRGVENRIDDSVGERGLRQQVVFMPYRRQLAGGGEEQLLVSTEVIQDQDGDAGRRELHVDFMVGLVLTKEGVMVQ